MMNLLELPDGGLGLEFDEADYDVVLARLEQFGPVRHEHKLTMDVLFVAGARLVLGTEPGESCLISGSAAGDRILRELASGNAPIAHAAA